MTSRPSEVVGGGYTAREVEALLGLAPARLRGLVRAGLVGAARGAGGEVRFGFQDLVLLRTAQGLLAAHIAPRRVERALARLAAELPEHRGLSGLRITAEGGTIVVRSGGRVWDVESGQAVLDFSVDELAARVAAMHTRRVVRPADAAAPRTADDWFAEGLALEAEDPGAAEKAYAHALALVPEQAGARLNLGRLLHERGELDGAERHYRAALAAAPADATAAFDLGVVLEDLGRSTEAAVAYETALAADPLHADAHYNLALLREQEGDRQAALRHLKEYRRLVRG